MRFSGVKKAAKEKKVKTRFTRQPQLPRTPHISKKTVNLAGGKAFTMDQRFELVNMMATSLGDDKFYEKADVRYERLKEFVAKDPLFVAKTAVFIRNEFGNRTISHVAAGEIAHAVKGEEWTKNFYDKVVYRLDDAIEILAYLLNKYGKPIPNSLKKGLGLALGRYDEYAFAKYRGENHVLSMVDVVNLIHPKPTEKNRIALGKLMTGELKNEDTWEAALSAAGSNTQLKAAAWRALLSENKLPYFALLKNLRNIMEQADDETLKLALAALKDKKSIEKSLVFPFRFFNAHEQLKLTNHQNMGKVLSAISAACDISCSNVPVFDDDTVIVVDDSGSMTTKRDSRGIPAAKHAALFACIILKANPDADLICFNQHARYVPLDTSASLMDMVASLESKFVSGGTNFTSFFPIMKKKYKRVIILSDEQGWMGSRPEESMKAYSKKFDAKPFVYSFDLAGYGTLQFPQERVFTLAGFSDKVFTVLDLLERDRNILIKEIESIVL